MKRDSVLSLLGIAKKAGKLVSGEVQTESAVKSGRANLVIISREASENTKKKFQNMSSWNRVPIQFYGTREELGAATGSGYRAVLAVLDEGLAEAVGEKIKERE